jgi:Protein of unknown function (DUF3887)
MTRDIPPDTEDMARALFGDLVEGRWEKAYREFDVGMRGHVDVDQIARGWSHLADSAGDFESMGAASARQSGDYTVVAVPLTFESGDAIGRVVLDHDRKVAGLTWQYPRRRRLDPRRVQVFALGNGGPEVAGALHARP